MGLLYCKEEFIYCAFLKGVLQFGAVGVMLILFEGGVMYCTLLKSKLHHIRVTQADKEYEGSLTIDEDLMDAVGIFNYEKLLVANLENGNRFETYAIRGPRGSGVACLNGAVAHLGQVGDRLIIMVWCQVKAEAVAGHKPRVVRLDEKNRIVASAV